MTFRQGPYPVTDEDLEILSEGKVAAPPRDYACGNYDTCLNLAAALNWENFHCCGCTGHLDEALLWRARQSLKKDDVAHYLCHLPETPTVESHPEHPRLVSIGGKR